jgi:hypothetical protein
MAVIRESHEGQLGDVADDLAALAARLGAGAAVAAADALTSSQNNTANAALQTGSYVQADVESIRTLANALKVSYNALQVDVAALRTKVGELITAATAVDGAVTIKTVRG